MRTVKLVLIGPSGVGKSALRGKYLGGRFFSGYKATIGADFITKTLPYPSRPEDSVSLQIWDTAGQERFSSLSNAFFRGADAALLMFDVNNPESMESLTKWWTEFCDRAPLGKEDEETFCCVLVGNKIDLDEGGESRRVTEMEALEFLQRLIPPSSSPYSSPPDASNLSATRSPTITNGHIPLHSNSINIGCSNSNPKRDITTRLKSKVSFLSSPINGGAGTVSSIQSGISNYHTPSSSLFEEYHSASSSPPLPDHCSQGSSSNTASSGSAETVTPNLFVRGTTEADASTPDNTVEDITISLVEAEPELSPSCQPSSPPYHRPKLFFTSAKTGEGVSDVFEYIAERVVQMAEYEEQIEARRMHVLQEASGSIRLQSDSHHYGQKWKLTCCST